MTYHKKNKLLWFIFPPYRFRDKKRKWIMRVYDIVETMVMFWSIFWLMTLVIKPVYFDNKSVQKELTFYSTHFLEGKQIFKVFAKSEEILKKYGIDITDLDSDIYLVNDKLLYFASMPPGFLFYLYYSSAYTHLLSGDIYFKSVDISTNSVHLSPSKVGTIPFSMVLTHELVHVWQEKKFGFFQSFFSPKWVKEGYAVYVSEEIDALEGKRAFLDWIINNKPQSPTMHQKYILWGLMVKHAIEKLDKSVDDLHLGKVSYDEVYESLLNEYNITNER